MIRVRVDVKKLFFDRSRVLAAMDKATAQSLNRAGALVRTIARGSIRRVTDPDKHAPAGHAPFSHVPSGGGFQGLKHIFYYYDPLTRSVMVGPIGRASRRRATVPEIQEDGGTVKNRLPKFKVGGSGPIAYKPGASRGGRNARGQFTKAKGRTGLVYGRLRTSAQVSRAKRLYRVRHPATVRVAAHPFMGPAVQKAAPKIPHLFRNSVRGL